MREALSRSVRVCCVFVACLCVVSMCVHVVRALGPSTRLSAVMDPGRQPVLPACLSRYSVCCCRVALCGAEAWRAAGNPPPPPNTHTPSLRSNVRWEFPEGSLVSAAVRDRACDISLGLRHPNPPPPPPPIPPNVREYASREQRTGRGRVRHNHSCRDALEQASAPPRCQSHFEERRIGI
jgi:hypothetical protein